MTKLLSELLEAKEPEFRQTINKLELANTKPSQDIRLSQEVKISNKTKLTQLKLDPEDTKGAELYRALQEKMLNDDAILNKHLRSLSAKRVSASADLSEGIV